MTEAMDSVRGTRFNDALADSSGAVLSGTMPSADHESVLVRIEPDGRSRVVERGLRQSKGMALAADERTRFHVDTRECELGDGTRVPAGTARRLACDASVVEVTKDADGLVLHVGRRVRNISPALRRALEVRDRGCRFPGCGLRYTDAHHIVHWADGGETTLLICRIHHRYVHENGWRVASDTEGKAVFFSPLGKACASAPAMPSTDADALVRRNRERGVEPDWRTNLPAA